MAGPSKIVKHNGIAYLTGQVAEGDTIQEQVRAELKVEFMVDAACDRWMGGGPVLNPYC